MTDNFEFRSINPDEVEQAIAIEQICFPPNEACSPKSLTERIKATAETFLVAEDKETGKLAAFLNGVPTDEEAFRDEFFTDISLSNPEGKNIMLLGLDVRPEYRMQGLGRELVSRYCQKEAQKGRKKLFIIFVPKGCRLVPNIYDQLNQNLKHLHCLHQLRRLLYCFLLQELQSLIWTNCCMKCDRETYPHHQQ